MTVLELRIKNKHLAEEARIIKSEEQKLKNQTRHNIEYHKLSGANEIYPIWKDESNESRIRIQSHRKSVVRDEQRATFLARAFLEGRDCPEKKLKDKDKLTCWILPRAHKIANKYFYLGKRQRVEYDEFKEWYFKG